MSQTIHIIDAFTDKPFGGNPAAVCLLESDKIFLLAPFPQLARAVSSRGALK
jgi:hypothetical protein